MSKLGISYERVAGICRKFSITPKQAAGMHPNSRKVTRYDPEADRLMVERIKKGGSGEWGAMPMPAQPQLSDADARAIVKWMMAR